MGSRRVEVEVEGQNRFELRGRTATLAGRPDIITHREDEAVVVDAKTGQESPSHAVQVMIYLYAVPKALQRYRNAKLRGQVTYRDHTVRIPPDASDEAFIENLGALIRRLSATNRQDECRHHRNADSVMLRPPTAQSAQKATATPEAGETADF